VCTAAQRLAAVAVFAIGSGACTHMQAPASPGGSVVCTLQFVYGLAVTVKDAATGQNVCDAQVTAVSGSFRETLPTSPPSANCGYAGAGERAGVYEVSASKPGYLPATASNIRVDANECHVIPVPVVLELKK